jgi:5-methylcytosine-specific restriction endonuclease McrA
MENKKLKNWVISVLRKASYRWKPRGAVKKAAKVATASYVCYNCDIVFYTGKREIKGLLLEELELLKRPYKKGKVHVDHIAPIVPMDGFKNGQEFDFNEYIENMYCEEDGLQILCAECHKAKTEVENTLRREIKREKKES